MLPVARLLRNSAPVRRVCLTFLLLGSTGIQPVFADGSTAKGELSSAWSENIVAATVKAMETEDAVSVVAVPLNGPGLPQYINADSQMSPGSIMKLVTTYAALEILGPTYQWQTRFSTDGQMIGKTLKGNLYVTMSGDPRLTLERLWSVMQELRGMGIDTIEGDLVLDGHAFNLPDGLPRFVDNGNNPYAPFLVEPSPYLTNFNLVHFQVRADERGTTAWATPALNPIVIDNRVNALPEGRCPSRRGFDWTPNFHDDGTITISVTGKLPRGCRTTAYLSLLSPDKYTLATIRSTWAEMGGLITGASRVGETPDDTRLIMTTESPDLVSTIRDINKWSNNVMARQLLLAIGAEKRTAEDADDRQAGVRAISEWLATKGVDTEGLVIENGSGLSRDSRITARQGAQILQVAWKSPYASDLLASLPLIAMDGTMYRRLRNTGMAGLGRIKTGYLEGVRSIAGFSRDINDTTWAVVAMVNHDPAWNGQALLDRVLYSLYHQPPVGTAFSKATLNEKTGIR
ncbi:D-alanyl-D-alanine carboxypeptidase/D-alanyl-D-alanine-endopeptidase [Marinobacter sp. BGYM27]|uniref:D-alanyl-D-alanine carboxypeptidase/D-alanyl-D-alanine endopeptidase n=1 Tax=Marinobacter sp. BGYM27 TaxID=2975597 RepID=UPI0021A30A2B|nr:D-alanyl-D-alanine carboxypeptidase/D-alanyl-D-alanine-endopeptidase [Marinobacter sp. BGYM27]MDG5498326.1 D-alanyl-D-alanine carboxypeptidase/D-alanyl-D-alanine-endopeptidase [Marinobacter sp. BGYM27]